MRKVLLVVYYGILESALSFSPLRSIQGRTFLKVSPSDDVDRPMDEAERMSMVRQLQKQFYSDAGTDMEYDESTGIIRNLPLWRVGWVELPGRSNCLNVHEGHFTNMFETILASGSNWFGHLHLPGGSSALKSRENRFMLKDWATEAQDQHRFDEPERSAVLGCLMRITDHRRMKDGRLLILVQAVERFVVTKSIQDFPYGLADVQLLPDADALAGLDENFGAFRRATAVKETMMYMDYESKPILLPLPKESEYMANQEVYGSEIAKCLPFCFYDINGDVPKLLQAENAVKDDSFAGGQPLLEDRLLGELILRKPPPVPRVAARDADCDALEKLLWLALEDFCECLKFQLPDEILILQPPEMDYLNVGVAKELLSEDYPVRRRQTRLSYTLPAIIENTTVGASLRSVLLQAPTTQSRLSAVLDRFQLLNDTLMGRLE